MLKNLGIYSAVFFQVIVFLSKLNHDMACSEVTEASIQPSPDKSRDGTHNDLTSNF